MSNSAVSSNFIPVSTVAPAAIPARMFAIVSRTKETKGETLADSQRQRAILIPEFSVADLPSKWIMFATQQLAEIARAQLAELWKLHGNELREVHASLFTVDSLLAYASREAESRRLTSDSVAAACVKFVASLKKEMKAIAKEILISM